MAEVSLMFMRSETLLLACSGIFIRILEVELLILIYFVRFTKMDEDQDMLQACVEDLTSIIDKDGDGDISKEEFVKNAVNSTFIDNLLSK